VKPHLFQSINQSLFTTASHVTTDVAPPDRFSVAPVGPTTVPRRAVIVVVVVVEGDWCESSASVVLVRPSPVRAGEPGTTDANFIDFRRRRTRYQQPAARRLRFIDMRRSHLLALARALLADRIPPLSFLYPTPLPGNFILFIARKKTRYVSYVRGLSLLFYGRPLSPRTDHNTILFRRSPCFRHLFAGGTLVNTPFTLLCVSVRRSTTAEKCRKVANIPSRRRKRNRIDRSRNINLQRDKRSLPPTEIFVAPQRTAA